MFRVYNVLHTLDKEVQLRIVCGAKIMSPESVRHSVNPELQNSEPKTL